jgi:flavin-dependent dehydrogenase
MKGIRMSVDYDCIVIGGGPGGSTAATLLADAGRKVLVLERCRFPRFHIGESLMPETYWVFKRLGMLEKMKASHFVRKYSVQFVSASGKESQPFYFDEMNPHECSVTWQVLRSEFDQMMLENSAEHGAEVWQDASVNDVLLEKSDTDDLPRATGVVVSRGGGAPQRISARVIVDATGTSALLAKKLGIKGPDPMLRKAAFFAHYRGGRRDAGKDEGATLVLSTRDHDGWFWYIPLPDDIVSVGVVGDIDRLISSQDASPEQVLQTEIEACPPLVPRLQDAQRVSPVHVLSDFSYRARRCAGDGWVLVGDAFGFLDPMYSSGVFLALKSAELAADCINEAFDRSDFSAGQLSRWGPELSEGMQSIRKLVYAFYTRGFSFGKFVREYPEFKKNLVDLLIGNVFQDGINNIFTPMSRSVQIPESIPLSLRQCPVELVTGTTDRCPP